jgi:hypothetical protein
MTPVAAFELQSRLYDKFPNPRDEGPQEARLYGIGLCGIPVFSNCNRKLHVDDPGG